MPDIRAERVKELRSRTGAGLMDCKKALVESKGNMDCALQLLREKGLAAASAKGGRVASEGLVHAYVSPDQKIGVLIEVNCETDFVAKNFRFKQFVEQTARQATAEKPESLSSLHNLLLHDGTTVQDTIKSLVIAFGENISIRRFVRFEANQDSVVDFYIHEDYLTEGKIGVLLETTAASTNAQSDAEWTPLIKSLLLHIAAMKPQYVSKHDIPADVLNTEKSIYQIQASDQENLRKSLKKCCTVDLTSSIKRFACLNKAT